MKLFRKESEVKEYRFVLKSYNIFKLNSMKKGLSAYWWCQFAVWIACVLTGTFVYFVIPANATSNFYPAIFFQATIGILLLHIMRLFIIKGRLLELNVFKKLIYLIPVTALFSVFASLIIISLNVILQWESELFRAYSFGSKLFLSFFSNFLFFGIWNLIYFIYHYIEKNRLQQTQAMEHQIKAMVATQEDERKRISRDLHDDVGTKLSALKLFLSSLQEKASDSNNEEIKSLALSSEQFITEAMHDVRQLLLNLSPTVLEEFGYTTAVEGLVNKINETKQINFNLVVFGMKERLQKDYELALYRITQELINNVLKHAEAKNVSLQIGQRDEKIILMMEDDGKGFDVSTHKDGYGLHNLDARTRLMQGTIVIDSKAGKGTSVLVEIPYHFNET